MIEALSHPETRPNLSSEHSKSTLSRKERAEDIEISLFSLSGRIRRKEEAGFIAPIASERNAAREVATWIRSNCNIDAEPAKRDASGLGGRKNFQRDAFLQSPVCGINLHEVSAEKKSPAELEARRASEKRRGCLCAAISYSRLLAVNLHTTKESKVRAEGLGDARCKASVVF